MRSHRQSGRVLTNVNKTGDACNAPNFYAHGLSVKERAKFFSSWRGATHKESVPGRMIGGFIASFETRRAGGGHTWNG